MIPLVIFCVLIEAVFTAMEVSFGTVPKTRLRALAEDSENQKSSLMIRAAAAAKLSERNDQLTLLFLTVTCLTMWSAAALLLWWLKANSHSSWWILAAMLPVLFVAEVLPLAIAARFAESIVLHSVKFLRAALLLCCPLLWIIRTIAHGIAVLNGSSKNSSMHLTEDEVRSAIATAEEEGVLDQSERDMLEMAMDFRSKLVREVMTPRPDIMAVSDDLSLEETLKCSFESGHSRLPVYQGSLDKIVGIVAIKDMVPLARSSNGDLATKKVGEMVRAAYFVPEDKHISTTFEEMRRRHTLMAIVVDDEGTTTGLITIEDLLEELVGEIQDEYDNEEAPLQRDESNGVSCDASVSVRDFERFWEREFNQPAQLYTRNGEEADDSISLAALALDLFDGVPQLGAQSAAGSPDLTLTVLGMDGPRIVKVLLKTASHEEPRA
jgi:CBS domain containing-hemolysin-like protein